MTAVHEEMRGWDAVETAARIREREVSREEVLEATIARAEAAEDLGAIVTACFDRARGSSDHASGPFAGVPTFIKDLVRVGGVATGYGTLATGKPIAKKSDPVAQRMDDLGFITLGKSATPELGLTATTECIGQPPCRNPWDLGRSSGGSSGGAASLVAAGVVPLAQGSDGGGSIRIPAAWCGLVGLKVSRHRLDMEGSELLPVNVAVNGVLTRTVRDTIAFWNALESAHPPKKLARIGDVAAAPARKLRIGMFIDSPTGEVQRDHVAAVEAAGARCASLGHHVEAIKCPFSASINHDFLRYWGLLAWLQKSGGKVMMSRSFDGSKLDGWTLGLAKRFQKNPAQAFSAIRRLRAFAPRYRAPFERYDLLLSPTNAVPAAPLGHVSPEVPFETLYERITETWPFTPIENLAGAPAISLPLARTDGGLPIGVQFAAAFGQDRVLLELARSLEADAPWPLLAPRAAP